MFPHYGSRPTDVFVVKQLGTLSEAKAIAFRNLGKLDHFRYLTGVQHLKATLCEAKCASLV